MAEIAHGLMPTAARPRCLPGFMDHIWHQYEDAKEIAAMEAKLPITKFQKVALGH